MKTFNEYVKNRKAISQLCAYFEQILDIAKKIKNLIAADRNGDWEAHLQAVQELIPMFAECDSIHYLFSLWLLSLRIHEKAAREVSSNSQCI